MLVLTRKIGQKIIIDDSIEISVIEVRGDAVKIGINAPKNVSVYRQELYEDIKASNKSAHAAPAREKLDTLLASLPIPPVSNEKPH